MPTTDNADEDGTVICTDGRYLTQVAEQVPDLRAVTPNNMTYSICTAGVFPAGQ